MVEDCLRLKLTNKLSVVDVRAVLANAVEEGLMESGIMKNVSKTKYWFFSNKVKYDKDEDNP